MTLAGDSDWSKCCFAENLLPVSIILRHTPNPEKIRQITIKKWYYPIGLSDRHRSVFKIPLQFPVFIKKPIIPLNGHILPAGEKNLP